MYQFYTLLKDRQSPPTDEEKAIASKSSGLDESAIRAHIEKLPTSQSGTQTIGEGFDHQMQVCLHPFPRCLHEPG